MFDWSKFLLKYPRHETVRRKISSFSRNHRSSFGLSGSSHTYRWKVRRPRRVPPSNPGFSHGFSGLEAGTLRSADDGASCSPLVWTSGSCFDVMSSDTMYVVKLCGRYSVCWRPWEIRTIIATLKAIYWHFQLQLRNQPDTAIIGCMRPVGGCFMTAEYARSPVEILS